MLVRALQLCAFLMLLGPFSAHAENEASLPAAKNEAEPTKGGKSKERDKVAVTPEREAAVMTFVKQHHAELADLLTHLKTKNGKEYDRAIRELFRASEQLAQVKERDPVRYDIELKLWKVKSRLQLLAAKAQMGGPASHQEEIKAALAEQFDLEISLLDHEHGNQAEKLERLVKRIARAKATRENTLEQQFQLLMNSGKTVTVEPGKARHPEKLAPKSGEKPVEALAPPAENFPAPK